jgi:hypothetical protein
LIALNSTSTKVVVDVPADITAARPIRPVISAGRQQPTLCEPKFWLLWRCLLVTITGRRICPHRSASERRDKENQRFWNHRCTQMDTDKSRIACAGVTVRSMAGAWNSYQCLSECICGSKHLAIFCSHIHPIVFALNSGARGRATNPAPAPNGDQQVTL